MNDPTLIEFIEKHFNAVKLKNADEILSTYAEIDDLLVFVEGPRWATIGYKRVEKGWRDFTDSAISVENCEWVEFLQAKSVGNMGFVAGIVEMHVNINGNPKTIKFRGTFILEKSDVKDWKVVHEHFSQPAEDPYGIGDWLKKD
jgi:ketosteroid isomerase-like protein